MTRTLLPLVLLIGACSSETDSGDSAEECGVTVTTFPTSGAIDAYYRTAVEFHLNKADSTAEVTSDVPGTQTVSADGLTVYYTPTEPLAPSTPYTFTLNYCSGAVELSFQTSSLGTEIADPEATIQGSSYLLNLKDARITEPPGVGSLLAGNLDGVDIYVNVTDVNDTEIKMIGAMGNVDAATPTQDWCSRTIDFPTADFTAAPHFELGGDGKTTITVAGYSVDIQDLRIAGDFAADGSYFGGGVLHGTVDTRPLDIALEFDAGQICEMAGGLGAPCEACEDGALSCLTLTADSITAVKSDIQITAIYGDDCAGCTTGVPADNTPECLP